MKSENDNGCDCCGELLELTKITQTIHAELVQLVWHRDNDLDIRKAHIELTKMKMKEIVTIYRLLFGIIFFMLICLAIFCFKA